MTALRAWLNTPTTGYVGPRRRTRSDELLASIGLVIVLIGAMVPAAIIACM